MGHLDFVLRAPFTEKGVSVSGVPSDNVDIVYTKFKGSSCNKGVYSVAYAIPDPTWCIFYQQIASHKIFLTTYGSIDLTSGGNDIYDDLYDSGTKYHIYISSTSPSIYSASNYWGTSTPSSDISFYYKQLLKAEYVH